MTVQLDSTTLLLLLLIAAAVFKLYRLREDHKDMVALRKDMRAISSIIRCWVCHVDKPPAVLQEHLTTLMKREGISPDCD